MQHHKGAIIFNLQPTGNFEKLPRIFTFFQALDITFAHMIFKFICVPQTEVLLQVNCLFLID